MVKEKRCDLTKMATVRRRKHDNPSMFNEEDVNTDLAVNKPNFQWTLWLLFCIENWVLDFGRPIFALFVSANFPLSLPSIGDYCHMLYNVLTALVLISLLQNSLTPLPNLIQVN